MSHEIIPKTIIVPESILCEIELLRDALSKTDDVFWSMSDTVQLLIQYCFNQKDNLLYKRKDSFLEDYLFDKDLFLEKFVFCVCRSAH